MSKPCAAKKPNASQIWVMRDWEHFKEKYILENILGRTKSDEDYKKQTDHEIKVTTLLTLLKDCDGLVGSWKEEHQSQWRIRWCTRG